MGASTHLALDALRILHLSGPQNHTRRPATASAVAALPNCLSLRARVLLLRVTGQASTLAWWANQKESNWCFGAVGACSVCS